MTVNITFLGGTGTVTGSKYLEPVTVPVPPRKVMLTVMRLTPGCC